MAKRFHSEDIISLEGYTYVLDVYDSSFGGASTEFKVSAEGFELSYENESADPFEPVNPSRVQFQMFANTSGIETLISDMVTASENRFLLRITKDGSIFWFGKMIADIGVLEDYDRDMNPYFTFTATDGLGLLAEVDYNDDGDPYFGKQTFIQHIVNALGKIGTLSTFHSAGTQAICTVVNWYENSHTTGAAQDPYALTRVAHEAFWSIDSKGVFKYKSTLEVLRQITQLTGARLYQANGAFRFEQLGERDNNSIRERFYDLDGTYVTNALTNYNVTVAQTTNARLAGNQFSWFPPVKEVQVTFNHEDWRNYTPGVEFDNAGDAVYTATYDVTAGANTTIRISTDLNRVFTYSGVYTAVFAVFKLRLQVGSYYLKRSINNIFGANITWSQTTWETTTSDYHFTYQYQITGTGTLNNTSGIVIDTPALPGDGELKIKLDFVEFRKIGNGDVQTTGVGMTYKFSNLYTRLLHYGNFAEETTAIQYNSINSTGSTNTKIYKLDFYIADAIHDNTINRLEVYDGANWSNSSSWRVGTSGSYVSILTLLGTEILGVQKKPLKKYLGRIKGQFDARHRLSFDSAYWVFLGGTLTARTDEWRGTWVWVARDITGITQQTGISIGVPGVTDTPNNNILTPSGFADKFNTETAISIGGLIGGVLSSSYTSSVIASGTVTEIAVVSPLKENAFQEGQKITIVNPITGSYQNLTVTSNSVEGDTTIQVTGYVIDDYPENSQIIVSPQNETILGFSSNQEENTEIVSNWWDIFQQWWEVDNTNDPAWPIEAPNIVIETDENAGDGATAGLRFDGDGLQSFSSSSATPGVKIGLAGKLELNNLDTGTGTDGLIVESGVVKKKTLSTVISDHGGLSGLADDDHTQYHNDTRGDARYYTQTQLDAGQLDNRYFTESEHLNTSAGAGDAGKPVKLDAGGHIDATMINDADIDHGSIGGLSDDDHAQYVAKDGRSGGQTVKGGTAAGENLRLDSTANATKGTIHFDSDVYGNHGFDFRTNQNAGNGSTAGLTLKNSDGIKGYKNSSATPTFYILQTGAWEVRSSGSAGSGASGILISDSAGFKTWKSTSSTPSVLLDHTGKIDLRSTPTVGDGSTAGVQFDDTNGLRSFKSTSATPTFHIKTDGTVILNYDSHPTPAAGLIYQNAGIFYTANAAGTEVHPQLGYIIRFNLFGYGENWAVGTCKEFFRFTSEYSAYEIYQIGYGFGANLGSGTGNNYIDVKFRDDSAGTDSTLMTFSSAGAFNNNITSITAKDIDQSDAIWFDCTAVKSTPAQGCTVDVYIRLA